MATVQANMLNLALRVDPRDSDGNLFTTSTIGVNSGKEFSSPQRLLDIYNEARKVLFGAIRERFRNVVEGRTKKAVLELSKFTVRKTNLTFADGAATIPSDYQEGIFLRDSNDIEISILALDQMGGIAGMESGEVRFVFEVGTQFQTNTGAATYIPNGADYELNYLGFTDWILTDVTDGTANELFKSGYEPILIEIAEAIAHEQGLADVLTMARTLVSVQGALQ